MPPFQLLSPAGDISFHPKPTFLSPGADFSFTQGRHGCAIGGLGLAQGKANPPPKGFALCSFRLLSDAGSAIIRLVSRKEILETLIFDIPAAVKGAAGWLARIG